MDGEQNGATQTQQGTQQQENQTPQQQEGQQMKHWEKIAGLADDE